MLRPFTADNHYWLIDADIWSSALPGYVLPDNRNYQAWVASGGIPTRIASEEELDEVLLAAGFPDRSPNPPKRTVPKSVIVSRLTDKQLTAIRGLLTVRQEERWRAPNYPAVNHDDPDTIAVLRAVGADPDVILAP